ncbi:uncharacterized protein [Gossypium hirsutum]|uniref:H(+)-exporting diphosphatase n=1 Tax=Gossypium hirsutum TaxID=3635 RepID=A0ABM3ALV1_GOSHI|nr:uncharacterized protein LOC121220273 [Gossypium hirsutum]
MSYRFFSIRHFPKNTTSTSHFLLISFPPHFLSVHQRQPLLLIGVLLLLGLSTALFVTSSRDSSKDYKEEPDYGRYVAIVASASLREMIKPDALAIISPIVVEHDS